MPAVSVLMAVYNAERYVAEAITSVISQSFSDFELIVIDDGSTDRTADIVRGITDARIRFMPAGGRLGLPGALNFGLDHATGEFVARHDHDDLSEPQRFAQQVAFLRAHADVALVGTRAWLIDESGRRTGRLDRPTDAVAVHWYHLLDNPFVHSSVMFRRAIVWGELRGYDATLPSSEDYELWSRVLRRHRGANLPDRLLSYRLSAVSKMAADENAWEEGPFPKILRGLVRREIVELFGSLLSDDELRLMSGFVLGIAPADVDRFCDVFWRLASAYEARVPDASRSRAYRRTVAQQVDAVAARLRPFSRAAAFRVYRRALAARSWLATELPWGKASARLAFGASGRATLARLRRQSRTFSVAA